MRNGPVGWAARRSGAGPWAVRSVAAARCLAGDLGALFVPVQCPGCRRRIPPSALLCGVCARRVRRVRPVRVLLGTAGGTLAIGSTGPLEGAWGRVVRAYKEDPVPSVARLAESRTVRALARRGSAAGAVLVPVPMAPVRRRQRGCNPPETLALGLARRLGTFCAPRALCRVRWSRPLRGLGAAERRDLMAGAFVLGEAARGLDGRPVLLIDDVLTTGATLRAASETLRAAGIGPVRAWTLGRTPRRGGRTAGRPRRRSRRGPFEMDGACFEKS